MKLKDKVILVLFIGSLFATPLVYRTFEEREINKRKKFICAYVYDVGSGYRDNYSAKFKFFIRGKVFKGRINDSADKIIREGDWVVVKYDSLNPKYHRGFRPEEMTCEDIPKK